MTYEERQYIRRIRSEIALAKEQRIRKMHVITLYGKKLYLGGESRPEAEQSRTKFPSIWDKHGV